MIRTILRITLPLAVLFALAGPVIAQVQKPVDNGPDAERLVFVFVAEGYTAGQLVQFQSDINSSIQILSQRTPWKEHWSMVNIYTLALPSVEDGADKPPLNVFRNTRYDASYWTSNIERLLYVNTSKVYADVATYVPTADEVGVLVNDTKYGGGGGSLGVWSRHSNSLEILIHELGHSAFALADEYGGTSGLPGSANEPNVTFANTRATLPWRSWVEPSTPVPTVPQGSFPTQVGAFEGAKYTNTGVYRPWNNCEMRNLNRPFCPVCNEVKSLTFRNAVPFFQQNSPSGDTMIRKGGTQIYTVDPFIGQGDTVRVTWRLNGIVEPSVTDQVSVILDTTTMALGSFQLTADVRIETGFVRDDPARVLEETATFSGVVFQTQFTDADRAIQTTEPRRNVGLQLERTPSGADTVEIRVTGGTATAGEDFTYNGPIQVSWGNGSSPTKTVDLPLLNDTVHEVSETIELGLYDAADIAAGPFDSLTITILDPEDDPNAPGRTASSGDCGAIPGQRAPWLLGLLLLLATLAGLRWSRTA